MYDDDNDDNSPTFDGRLESRRALCRSPSSAVRLSLTAVTSSTLRADVHTTGGVSRTGAALTGTWATQDLDLDRVAVAVEAWPSSCFE